MLIPSRGMPYVLVAAILWIVWLVGAITQTPIRSLAVLSFDVLGAFILLRLAGKLPATLRPSVIGLGAALVFIALGDSILTYSLLTGIPRADSLFIREPLYYLGSLLVVIASIAFPFAMQRQGLYPTGRALRLVIGSVVFALALTALISFVSQSSLGTMVQPAVSQIIFQFVVYLLTALFAAQSLMLGSGKLARTLRQMSYMFVLVSLARVATLILGGQYLGELVYDFLWCAGMTMAAYMMATKE